MEFKTVGGHTFDESLLDDGVIIDVGCRAFEFANYFQNKVVYCIDPDQEVFKDESLCTLTKCALMNLAISDKSGESGIYINGEATCLKEIDPDQNHPFVPCKTITMDELYEITGTNVDVLKLDCEGAEYIILGETFKPIPKQISVEFHKHCVPDMHNKHIDSIIERLSKDYIIYGLEEEKRHGCSENFWDVLFLRKW
jgi:FkbM family methyltransferase